MYTLLCHCSWQKSLLYLLLLKNNTTNMIMFILKLFLTTSLLLIWHWKSFFLGLCTSWFWPSLIFVWHFLTQTCLSVFWPLLWRIMLVGFALIKHIPLTHWRYTNNKELCLVFLCVNSTLVMLYTKKKYALCKYVYLLCTEIVRMLMHFLHWKRRNCTSFHLH